MVNAFATLYYLSFLSFLDPKFEKSYGDFDGDVPGFQNIDDTPYLAQKLPFPFLLASRLTRTVYIDMNGALHNDKLPACFPSNSFSAPDCRLVTNYTETLGGWLTDLNSHNCPSAAIQTYTNASSWTALYSSVCYYGQNVTSSFAMSLFKDHSVTVDYIDIFNTSRLNITQLNYINYTNNPILRRGDYSSGYRFSAANLNRRFILDNKQFIEGRTVWTTVVPGVFPSTRQIQSGYQYHVCPISTEFRAQNNKIYLSGGSVAGTAGEVLVLQPMLLSCVGKVTFSLVYTPLRASGLAAERIVCGVYDGAGGLADDGEVPGLDVTVLTGLQPNSVVCNVSSVIADARAYFVAPPAPAPALLTYNFTFQYTPSARIVNQNAALAPLSPLPAAMQLDLTYSWTTIPRNGFNSSVLLRVYNSADPAAPATPFGQCEASPLGDSCLQRNFCGGNSSCYYQSSPQGNICNSNTSINAFLQPNTRVLFDTYATSLRTCAGGCLGKADDGAGEDAVTDPLGVCCSYTSLDCAGYCPRTGSSPAPPRSVVSWDTSNATVCCSAPLAVDCANVCRGTSRRDACGVCKGTDMTGSSCFNIEDIHVSLSADPGAPTLGSLTTPLNIPPFVSSADPPAQYNITQRIYLHNKSGSNVTFALGSSPRENDFPDLALQPTQYPTIPILWTYLQNNRTTSLVLTSDWNTLFRYARRFPTASALTNNKLWSIQVLVLSVRRVTWNTFVFTRNINVFPRVRGCENILPNAITVLPPTSASGSPLPPLSTIGELNLCRALPGCYYCFDFVDGGGVAGALVRGGDGKGVEKVYRIVRSNDVAYNMMPDATNNAQRAMEHDVIEEAVIDGVDIDVSIGMEGRRRLFYSLISPKAQGHGGVLPIGKCVTMPDDTLASLSDVCPNIK